MFDLIILSLLSCLIIICCPARFLKETGFFTSVALLVVSLWHWVMDQGAFGLVTPVFTYFQVGLYNVYFSVDALSYFFILLTTFITFLCVLAAFFSVRQNLRFYLSCLFFLELLLIAAFSVLDFFFFLYFF